VRGVSKSFGGVRALDGVDLTIVPGEVHGLLGENGSGKSTLIKILAGFHAPDAGRLAIHGHEVPLPLPPGRFRELGISFVHQDLALIPSLTVLDNLRAGMIARAGLRPYVSWRGERRRAREVFARYGIRIDPGATVANLRPVDRALLAIVRALEEMREEHDEPGLLVLDEPTVFLPRVEVDHLFTLVREIAAGGGSVLFVSHDLDEVHEITDRVTVLRDGYVVGTVVTAEAGEGQLVEMIVGRRLAVFTSEHHDLTSETAAAAVRNLTGVGVLDVSFDLHAGEVLGITGLAGSGFESVPYLLFGAWPATRGRLVMDGASNDVAGMTPHRALRMGTALIPADRQRDGAVGSLTITDNVTLPQLDRYRRGMTLRRGDMRRRTGALMREYDVRPAEPGYDYGSLSGGNQQKALLAKWLQTSPRLILFHEPTQGVDVGARQQIFATIRDAAAGGACVLVASSDYEQLAAICDRVLVMGRGRVTRQLVGGEVTKDRITEQCYASAAADTSGVAG
jgi:ribose transport system ATP-binding protein